MTSEPRYRDTQYSRMLQALGSFIVFGVGVAVGAVYGDGARTAVWVMGLMLLVLAVWWTRLPITVDSNGIRVGAASLQWRFVQRVEVLEGSAMRAALSTDAHPRDYLRLRNTRSGVRVWLQDASDPHRCWVFSVRSAPAVSAVLAQLRPREVSYGT